MIERLTIEHFKGFANFTIDFGRINLIVGGNNSGKTTLFHALELLFWCVDQVAVPQGQNRVLLKKAQVAETMAVPNFSMRDLFHKQITQRGKGQRARIRITIYATDLPPVSAEIYSSYARNYIVSGGDLELTSEQSNRLRMLRPAFIPSMVGITVKEDFLRPIARDRLIREGNHSQVFRNIVHEVQQGGGWQDFIGIVRPLFNFADLRIPSDAEIDEWLSVEYKEGSNWFDLVSVGSGVLQLINILGFLYLHEPRVALVDEPDSHMHDDLQRVMFRMLEKISEDKDIQFMVSTHSSTMVDVAGLGRVLLVDKGQDKPLDIGPEDQLVEALADHGIFFIPSKVIELLRTQRALFVEGRDADYELFLAELGEKIQSGFRTITARLTILETDGQSTEWPFAAIAGFEKLMNTSLSYVYLCDRDFLLDHQITHRQERATREGQKLHHTVRRNRESYLIEPKVLSRLLRKKWHSKRGDDALPELLTEVGIRAWFVGFAKIMENKVQSDLLFQQESYLRSDRASRLQEVNGHFRKEYSEKVASNDVPWVLLDSKEALKRFRQKVAEETKISFGDKDILAEFTRAEIPDEINALVDDVLSLFPEERRDIAGQQILNLQSNGEHTEKSSRPRLREEFGVDAG